MEIEGYDYAYDLSGEEAQALHSAHRSFAIVDTDAMWHYMTTGQVEGQTNGRTKEGSNHQS